MVVQSHVAHQGLLQILPTVESMRFEHVGNAPVEALNHAIGSGRSGLGQPVLNAQGLAERVKFMVARGLTFAAGKQPVGQLLAVIGQQLFDLQRTRLVQGAEKSLCTGRRLVLLDRHINPTCGPVNGDKQIAALGLIRHLRQVLHIHVHVPWCVGLEGFVRLQRWLRLQSMQIAHTMAAQATVQARERGLAAEEFTGDAQQVVQRQQQRAAQLDDHALLCGCQGGLQAVCEQSWKLVRFFHL